MLTGPVDKLKSIRAIGRFGYSHSYGLALLGFTRFGEEPGQQGIYQIKHTKKGPKVSRENFYFPTQNRTPGQQAWRAVFASGKEAWDILTFEQKGVYNKRAIRYKFSGYNLFMREYLSSHRLG